MKLRLTVLLFGAIFAIHGLAAPANGAMLDLEGKHLEKGPVTDSQNGENQAEECDCEQQEHKHGDWQAKMAEREQKLLTWVDQYTPDKKTEWTQVLAEKKELRTKWLSPEFAEKREKWKQEKMVKIQDLKKQLERGKITKEEFVKQAHGGKNMSHWKTFHDLKGAVEAKNDQKAAELLNQLLEQSKQHNASMKEMMNK